MNKIQTFKSSDLNSNLDCPYCPGKKVFTNGCGGKGMKVVNKLLSFLPSSKLFHGACSLHDIVYQLVSMAPIKVEYPNGKIIVLRNRLDCDNIWLKEMLQLADHAGWYKKVMVWAAHRNYKLVRKNGAKFYKHDH